MQHMCLNLLQQKTCMELCFIELHELTKEICDILLEDRILEHK